jgi:putative transcriptional regulator
MKNLVGNLLIAPPALSGTFFQKTVVLLTEHHLNGSIGIVLNKPSQMSVKEFARQNNVILNQPGFVHIGGPVNVKALTMVHSNDWKCTNSLRLNTEFSVSSSAEILTRMAMGDVPNRWRIFAGLCSWSKGQLQNELDGMPPHSLNQSWVTATATTNALFDYDGPEQWSESIEIAGSEFAQNIFA